MGQNLNDINKKTQDQKVKTLSFDRFKRFPLEYFPFEKVNFDLSNPRNRLLRLNLRMG